MHLHSVKSYIEGLRNSNSKVYSKTKKKLTELSSDMLQCVQMISEILKEESLDTDETGILSSESTEFTDSDILQLSQDMADTISKFEELDQFNHMFTGVKKEDTSDSLIPVTSISPSSKQKKYIIRSYGDALRKLPDKLVNYPDAKLCSELLWKWYRIRFFESQSPDFHYNIKNLPIWLRNIVLTFGSHLEDGTIDKFCEDFEGWLSSVQQSGSKQSKYSVPYEVYALDITIKTSDVSLTSVVLWEILYENGLQSLSDPKLETCALQSETMYNLCTKYNPDIMEQYEYYENSKSERKEVL